MSRMGITLGLSLVGVALLAAQEPLRVDVRLVNIYATVIDSSGRYVQGLKKTDFLVEEDGRRQELAHFDHNGDTPISVGIVLDTSGSMRTKLDTATNAVDRFVRTLHPGDDIFLLAFNSKAYLLQDFTNDRSRLRKALRFTDSGGGTALYDALEEALAKVKFGANNKHAILLVTDGQDTSSQASFGEVRQRIRESELLVYSLGIGPTSGFVRARGPFLRERDTVDMNVLRTFAGDSGGRAYSVNEDMLGGRNSPFEKILDQIAEELRYQYTLGYYPTHSDDGQYHTINVRTRNGYYVRARRGYVAR